ncbi:Xyloglucan endo-transglycosylase, C-terminal [Sesbania bispinosa]|nr:Xyloglucan endo-transglycosylase, C-terminal [Sesbania bispinosa]
MILCTSAQGPPSPGYYPSSKIRSVSFEEGFRNLWGPQHQRVDQDTLTIWLDSTSGSGFKSLHSYRSGYFGAAIKLQPGYTAGVNTCIYLSNNQDYPGNHDEIDIEFLGTTLDKPYVLQTNVYIRGSGDRKIIGREMKFHLWFDPTEDFHNYAILWEPNEIMLIMTKLCLWDLDFECCFLTKEKNVCSFLVDDVPIRRYPRKSDATFPARPMYVYGSIWDASSWATEDGKYKADYKYQPFIGRYRNFKLQGCSTEASISCQPPSASPSGFNSLSPEQFSSMQWVQNNYMIYNYCHDPRRDHTQTPEC